MALTKALAVTQCQCPDNHPEFVNSKIIASGLDFLFLLKKKNIQTDSYSAAPEYQSSAQLYKNMIKVSPITIVQKDSIEKKKLKGKNNPKT